MKVLHNEFTVKVYFEPIISFYVQLKKLLQVFTSIKKYFHQGLPLKKSSEYAKDFYRYTCCVDLEEACDRVPLEKRWVVLRY